MGFGSDEWVLPASAHNETVAMLYTYCFYWSTLLLSTIGDVPLPVKRSEYIFVLLDYMIGMSYITRFPNASQTVNTSSGISSFRRHEILFF